jgi:DNA polymerase-1
VLTSPTALARFLSELLRIKIKSTEKLPMDMLRGKHPVIGLLMEWRPKYKLKTAFVDSLLRLQQDGLVFPDFNQCGTGTGRMSCSGPNLQQLPQRGDRTVRKGFIAPEGFLVASLDNSQIDLRSLAHLSQDIELMRIFVEGLDVHNETAMKLKGELTEAARRLAKTANFLVVFGGGSSALAAKTDVEESVAAAFLDAYWAAHPGVKAWVEGQHRFLLQNGFVETAYGRRRYIPEVYTKERGSAFRKGQNMPVQGTSADVLKLQMAAVAPVSVPFAQVHDELDFYVPKKNWKGTVRELVRLMEGVDCPFGLKVEASIGANLGEMEKVAL